MPDTRESEYIAEVSRAAERINKALYHAMGDFILALDAEMARRTKMCDNRGTVSRTENNGGVIEGSNTRHHTGRIVYRGTRSPLDHECLVVTRNAQLLHPFDSQQIINHSPDGFNCGYGGSGPAQLALALLLDATGDPDLAISQHQNFKRCFVMDWADEWEISQEDIITWLNSLDKDQGSEFERAIHKDS